jgi:hypothetical protein
MPATVKEFGFMVIARSLEDGSALCDRLANEFINSIGGMPWVLVADDWKRSNNNLTISDDQGFYYEGFRKYAFMGPVMAQLNLTTHPGYDIQRSVEDE